MRSFDQCVTHLCVWLVIGAKVRAIILCGTNEIGQVYDVWGTVDAKSVSEIMEERDPTFLAGFE
jgi:hypothetical protein